MDVRAGADAAKVLEVAIHAGTIAGALCQQVQAESRGAPDAVSKGEAGPVTIADYGSQAVILRAIRAAFPDHAIMAEEASGHLKETVPPAVQTRVVALVGRALGTAVDFDRICEWLDHRGRPGSDVQWTVDPLDGTKGFLRGGQYAIAIGVLRQGRPWAGVLVCPQLGPVLGTPPGRGTVFSAARGQGAKAGAAGDPQKPVRVNTTADPARARILASVESGHGDPALVRAVVDGLGIGGTVTVDSQVKYAVLARGEAEIYLRPRSKPDYREHVWDHAAGVILLEEAGGRVTDMDGRALDFTRGSRLEDNRGVLAINGALHERVVGAMRKGEGK